MVGTETVQPMYPVYLDLPFVYLCMPVGLLGNLSIPTARLWKDSRWNFPSVACCKFDNDCLDSY